jgi:hypothetical protein
MDLSSNSIRRPIGLAALFLVLAATGTHTHGDVTAIFGSTGDSPNDDAYVLRANDPDPAVEDLLFPLTQPTLGIDLDVAGGKMYYIDPDTNEIRRSNLDGSDVETIGSGFTDLTAIGLDLLNGKLYWGDSGIALQRSNLDGSSVETVTNQNIGAIQDIAVDAAGGKVYWINGGLLLRADLNGSNTEGVGAGDPSSVVPGSVALDLANGKVYWTHDQEGIRRANLDGSGPESLVLNAEDGGTNLMSIALDLAGGEMYWTNFGGTLIRKANLDGSGIRTIFRPENGATFFALDPTNSMMYWSENLATATHDILRATLPPIDIVIPDLITAGGLAVHDGLLYYVDTDLTGTTLGTGSIHRANLDGSDDQTLLSNLMLPFAIAIDPDGGKFYWGDPTQGIRRANLNGSSPQTVVNTTGAVHIDLDRINNKIYWTDGTSIRRANFDGTSAEPVVTGLPVPRGVAIHSGLSKVYWTQPDSPGGIFRANLNGTNVETVVGDADVDDPWSLKLDVLSAKMYWTERSGGPLRRANIDGSDVEIVYDVEFPAIEIALLTQKSAEVWVDFAHTGFEEGTESNPFNTVQEALAAVLSGGTIFLTGDSTDTSTDATPTINQAVTLEAVGGLVAIGRTGTRFAPAKQGFVAPTKD